MLEGLEARLERFKRELSEDLADRLAGEVRQLKELLRTAGPGAITKQAACERLSIGMTKLKGMIASGEIATCTIGKVAMIPLLEIERLTAPDEPKRRRSGGRPKAQKFNAKAEAAAGRAALKKT